MNIVSLSGGKDSTAMLLMMLERGEDIHSIVFFDTGWEFPEMVEHINKLKQYVWHKYNQKIWTLYPRLPFEYLMMYHISLKPRKKQNIGRVGYGWPSPLRRWCTARKIDCINYYHQTLSNPVACIGFGADEIHRVKSESSKRYPLIEWGITEADALQYCYDNGFNWGGLYKIFNRVSCFCCPMQRIGELKKLRKHFPDLWEKMLLWDAIISTSRECGFRGYKTVHDLDRRFAAEDKQILMFGKQ